MDLARYNDRPTLLREIARRERGVEGLRARRAQGVAHLIARELEEIEHLRELLDGTAA